MRQAWTSFYQLESSECSVPGCVGPSSGQRDDCVKASECLSDLLYSTMTFLVKRLINKLSHCTEVSSPSFPKTDRSETRPAVWCDGGQFSKSFSWSDGELRTNGNCLHGPKLFFLKNIVPLPWARVIVLIEPFTRKSKITCFPSYLLSRLFRNELQFWRYLTISRSW